MSQRTLLPLAIESACHYLIDPRPTPGEWIGGVIGSTYGPLGAFVGGTLGRMVESKLSDGGA